ncbi:MAG: alkene reductase [Alphaproteobacteria bacterium]|nr:alkene reductase [Alphaproteobacteria bacterium]
MSLLFSSADVGALSLKNRVVMAPMTRSRSIGNVPGELVATYYGQRAGAGLIITEGTSPSPDGLGYARIPGIYSDAQVDGWRAVADAVHAEGARIFVQLMHTGRVAHPANMPEGARVVGPSAVAAPGEMWTDSQGMQPHPVPHALTETEIEATIDGYVLAARQARRAGIDGVELHGANGYLIDQFLNVASNQRTDGWGGTIQGRARFAVEVARRVADAIGADRVGIRLSPYGVFNGMTPSADEHELFAHLAAALGDLGLAYVHIVDHSAMGAPPVSDAVKDAIRDGFDGPVILSGGYDAARAEADLAAGKGALVAFGRPFISNPDLVEKLASGAALTAPDPSTFYTPGPQGYTDY